MIIRSDEQVWELILVFQTKNQLSNTEVCTRLGIDKQTYFNALKANRIAGNRVGFLQVVSNMVGIKCNIREAENDN